jgi:transcriptional regulator with XRE-family HTH domain
MEWFERIKILRKQRGWSQDTLAQKAGYTDRSMISKIEKGVVDLQRSQLIRFAEIFDVSPSWLLGDVDIQQYKDDNGVLVMRMKGSELPEVSDIDDIEELIAKYQQLDDEGKEMMHERLDSLIKHGHVQTSEDSKKKARKQVMQAVSDLPSKKTIEKSLKAVVREGLTTRGPRLRFTPATAAESPRTINARGIAAKRSTRGSKKRGGKI